MHASLRTHAPCRACLSALCRAYQGRSSRGVQEDGAGAAIASAAEHRPQQTAHRSRAPSCPASTTHPSPALPPAPRAAGPDAAVRPWPGCWRLSGASGVAESVRWGGCGGAARAPATACTCIRPPPCGGAALARAAVPRSTCPPCGCHPTSSSVGSCLQS